mmetsp:Transcript_15386/g.42213  ORF Transcript_15386/g.42213 Transcript_15386/m.42213 type:complete len:121 (-) Transcript_15386:1245-1607(-)
MGMSPNLGTAETAIKAAKDSTVDTKRQNATRQLWYMKSGHPRALSAQRDPKVKNAAILSGSTQKIQTTVNKLQAAFTSNGVLWCQSKTLKSSKKKMHGEQQKNAFEYEIAERHVGKKLPT